MKKRVVIIGAGPGGLTSAMILAYRGYDVIVFEKAPVIGGRNASMSIDGYIFDTGPTFLMMTFILREMFELVGRKLEDYCTVRELDPMYKLSFIDKETFPTRDMVKMQEQITRMFPGNEMGLAKFYKKEKVRFEKMYPCLQRAYDSPESMVSPPLLRALPYLDLGKSLYQALGDYFTDEKLRISFTFQAKYLGMSPWQCPALFTIIPYIEHTFGIDHIEGGLSKISDAMATICREENVDMNLATAVKKIIVEKRTAQGVELENGERVMADAVVINADFGYAMCNLFEKGIIRKWTKTNLMKKKYSCSTFMLYLGLNTIYDEPHHNVVFAQNYHQNINDIVVNNRLSPDMSIYIRNASIEDPSLAPKGHSALYILVPVPNTNSDAIWDTQFTLEYKNKIIDIIQQRTSMKDLRKHITVEKIITPRQWETEYNLFLGATFNMGHTLSQMLYFRPHNKFEEVKRCYLVGGGTHPGSGLPTIYESARISSNLLSEQIPL